MVRQKLHPGAKWSFRIRAYLLFFFLSWFFGWFLIPASVAFFGILGKSIGAAVITFVVFGFLYIICAVVIAEIYARMAYNRWFYEFTEHQLRMERGIIWKKYSNLPYERVQNVDITRGILARMLRFSTIHIQTAGFSYAPNGRGMGSEGYIPAVTPQEAEHIREFLMKKISHNGRKQGL